MRIHYAGLQPHCCCVGKGRSDIVTAPNLRCRRSHRRGPQGTPAERVMRVGKVQAIRREMDKTVAPFEKEKPFNRKVAINAALKTLRARLQGLAK